jgi:hypothetical protein
MENVTAQREFIDSCFPCDMEVFEYDKGQLYSCLDVCAAILVMYHRGVVKCFGSNHEVARRLVAAAKKAKITHSSCPPGTSESEVLNALSNLLEEKYKLLNTDEPLRSDTVERQLQFLTATTTKLSQGLQLMCSGFNELKASYLSQSKHMEELMNLNRDLMEQNQCLLQSLPRRRNTSSPQKQAHDDCSSSSSPVADALTTTNASAPPIPVPAKNATASSIITQLDGDAGNIQSAAGVTIEKSLKAIIDEKRLVGKEEPSVLYDKSFHTPKMFMKEERKFRRAMKVVCLSITKDQWKVLSAQDPDETEVLQTLHTISKMTLSTMNMLQQQAGLKPATRAQPTILGIGDRYSKWEKVLRETERRDPAEVFNAKLKEVGYKSESKQSKLGFAVKKSVKKRSNTVPSNPYKRKK